MRAPLVFLWIGLAACGQAGENSPVGASQSTIPSAITPVPLDDPLDSVPTRVDDPIDGQPVPPAGPLENLNEPVTPAGAVCWAITEVALSFGRQTARIVADDPTLIAPEAAGQVIDPATIVSEPDKAPIESVDEAIAYLGAQGNTDGEGAFAKRLHDALVDVRDEVAALDPDDVAGFDAAVGQIVADTETWPGYEGLVQAAERSPHCELIDR